MKGLFVVIALLPQTVAAQSRSCDLVPKALLQPPRVELQGRYVNKAYEYSVVIPEPLKGYDDPQAARHNGIGIVLGEPPQSYILVQGDPNSLEAEAPMDEAIRSMQSMRERGMKILSATFAESHLGQIEAVRLVVAYTCPGSPERYVQDSTFALGPNSSKEPVYEVTLRCLASRYEKDRAVLDQILKLWKYTGR